MAKRDFSIALFITGILIIILGIYLSYLGVEEIMGKISSIIISYHIDSLLIPSYFVLLGVSSSPLTIIGQTLLFNGVFVLFIPLVYFLSYLNKFGDAKK